MSNDELNRTGPRDGDDAAGRDRADDIARPRKRAVIAVIQNGGQWLVIRRSESVRAPGKLCFPGGTIESGESQQSALVRELREELRLEVQPTRLLWTSHSSWGTELNWWTASAAVSQVPVPDPDEVAWCGWMWPEELERHVDTLPSNLEFLNAWREGRFTMSGNGTRG